MFEGLKRWPKYMVSTVVSQKLKYDRLFWALGLILITCGIAGYYYFKDSALLVRSLGLLVSFGIAGYVLFQTKQGKLTFLLLVESIKEVRKMVWPTRKETVHTTFAVLGMVLVMGLLLWTADFVLLRIVAWVTGQWET